MYVCINFQFVEPYQLGCGAFIKSMQYFISILRQSQLSVSFSVLFSESPNSGGVPATPELPPNYDSEAFDLKWTLMLPWTDKNLAVKNTESIIKILIYLQEVPHAVKHNFSPSYHSSCVSVCQ